MSESSRNALTRHRSKSRLPRATMRRRGAIAVWTAVTAVTLSGFAALAIDVGYMFSVQGELRRTADAAALAAAGRLTSGNTIAERKGNARVTAQLMGAQNTSDRMAVAIADSDVAFGSFTYDEDTGKYTFVPDESVSPSAVRVTARRPEVNLLISRIMGFTTTDISAQATAILMPRDIGVVIDLSGSMKHDSYLRFYDQTQINSRDMWCSLNGPAPSRPYTPGPENATEYAGDTGPTIGVMDTWGNAINPTTYNPTTDPGLWYLPQGSACTITAVHTKLGTRGYSASRIATITGATTNATEWRNRTAVMTGLAEWTPSSATDTSVGATELTWIPYPSYRINWAWTDYLDWAAESNNKLTTAHPQFRYRFGLKTYVDFLLDRKDHSSQTNLTATPEEPITAVKDAVQILINMTGSSDQVALATFGSTGRHEVNLSTNRQQVADTLYARQANHWDNSTNIGEGLQMAVNELTSVRARSEIPKIIVLMSDGASTTGPDPVTVAEDAAELGMKIYTVSVGYISDRPVMQEIAAVGNGQEFYAAGDPTTYTEQLRQIFRTIGGLRETVLID